MNKFLVKDNANIMTSYTIYVRYANNITLRGRKP